MQRTFLTRFSSIALLLAAALAATCAGAQQELAPPTGKGHVVVILSGILGPTHDKALAQAISALGYDVYFCDSRTLEGTNGQAVRDAIQNAQKLPHALPGKVALIGISLGGGMALDYASTWTDLLAVDILWYPVTEFLNAMPGFGSRITVPTLMFAGEADTYDNCCLIATARTLAADAKQAGAPFELVTYPGVNHDFIKGGGGYNEQAYNDALTRTAAKLKSGFAD